MTDWDKIVDVKADFDSTTDADSDMNDTVAAMHDGHTGLEITFDDANVAYGKAALNEIDQTSIVVDKWLHPNDLDSDEGADTIFLVGRNGDDQTQFEIFVDETAGAYKLGSKYRSDDNNLITIFERFYSSFCCHPNFFSVSNRSTTKFLNNYCHI